MIAQSLWRLRKRNGPPQNGDGPRTQTGDCVAPLALEKGGSTALHQPPLSRRTNEPDPENKYETGANKREDYDEVGRHGPHSMWCGAIAQAKIGTRLLSFEIAKADTEGRAMIWPRWSRALLHDRQAPEQ